MNQIQLFIQSDKFKLVVSGRHLKSVPFVVLLHAFEEGPVFFHCTLRLIMHVQCGISVTGFAKHVADFFPIPVPLFTACSLDIQ